MQLAASKPSHFGMRSRSRSNLLSSMVSRHTRTDVVATLDSRVLVQVPQTVEEYRDPRATAPQLSAARADRAVLNSAAVAGYVSMISKCPKDQSGTISAHHHLSLALLP